MTSSLVDLIESFNRKERHILWEQATGTGQRVVLSDSYRSALSESIGIDVPEDAYVAVDYHLNWLYGALLASIGHLATDDPGSVHLIPDEFEGRQPYERNQEDIDLLVVFTSGGLTHVVLVEAKAFTAWSTSQMNSKLRRLESIRKDTDGADAEFHLVLSSFENPLEAPRKLHGTTTWGEWKPSFVALEKPGGRLKTEQCTTDGAPAEAGEFVHIIKG